MDVFDSAKEVDVTSRILLYDVFDVVRLEGFSELAARNKILYLHNTRKERESSELATPRQETSISVRLRFILL